MKIKKGDIIQAPEDVIDYHGIKEVEVVLVDRKEKVVTWKFETEIDGIETHVLDKMPFSEIIKLD